MGRVRVTNNTDETIIIEPGDTVDLRGEEDIMRLMASRAKTFSVEGFEDKS